MDDQKTTESDLGSRNNSECEPPKPSPPASAKLNGYLETLSGLAQSAVLVLAITYLLGWIYGYFYFRTMGAVWLLTVIPTISLVLYSWITLGFMFSMFIGVYFQLFDLGSTCQTEAEQKARKRRLAFYKFVSDPITWGTCLVAHLLVGTYATSASVLHYITLGFLLLVWGSNLLRVAMFAAGRLASDVVFNKQNATIIAISGLALLPASTAILQAHNDLVPKTSSLPRVSVEGKEETDFRLLLNVEDRFYLVELANGEMNPSPLSRQ